jgi:hypothetical protein
MPEPLYIVTSPRPWVGKTLIARLVFECFAAAGRQVAGYDLNPRDPKFARRFPGQVETVNIADTRGEMALFDRLIEGAAATTVIDLGTAALERFFAVATEIGFLHEAQHRLIEPVVLFIADTAPATMRAYTKLQQKVPTASFVPVHNEAAAAMVTPESYPSRRREYGMLRIARLSEAMRSMIDRPDFSFANALQPEAGPTELQLWLSSVFTEIRVLELRLLMGRVGAALGGQSAKA